MVLRTSPGNRAEPPPENPLTPPSIAAEAGSARRVGAGMPRPCGLDPWPAAMLGKPYGGGGCHRKSMRRCAKSRKNGVQSLLPQDALAITERAGVRG
jgi:hypothetical protein